MKLPRKKITFKLVSKESDVAKRVFTQTNMANKVLEARKLWGLCSRNSWISETYARTTLMAGLPSGNESGQKE